MKKKCVVFLFLLSLLFLCGCHKKQSYGVGDRESYLVLLQEAVVKTAGREDYSLYGVEKITTYGATKETAYSVKSRDGKRIEQTIVDGKKTTEYFLKADDRYYIGQNDSTLGLTVRPTDQPNYELGGLIRFLRVANDFDLLDPTYNYIRKGLDNDISYYIQEIKFHTQPNTSDWNSGRFDVSVSQNKTVLRYDEKGEENVTVTLTDGVITEISACYDRNYYFDRTFGLEYVGRTTSAVNRNSHVEWTVNVDYAPSEVILPEAFATIERIETPFSQLDPNKMKNSIKFIEALAHASGKARLTQKEEDGTVIAIYEYDNNIVHYCSETEEEYLYAKDDTYHCLKKVGDKFKEIKISSKEKFYERQYYLMRDMIGFFGDAFHTPDGKEGTGETICLYGGLDLSEFYYGSEIYDLYKLAYASLQEALSYGEDETEKEKIVDEFVREVHWDAVVISGEKEKKYSIGVSREGCFVGTAQEGDVIQTRIWEFEERQNEILLPDIEETKLN